MPSTIQSVGADAFAGCTALTDVWVENPDAVTIGAGAFPAGVTVHVIAGSEAEQSFKDAGYTTVAAVEEFADKFTALNAEIKEIEAARATTVDVGTYYEVTDDQVTQYPGVEIRSFALNNRDAGILDIPEKVDYTNAKGETSAQNVALLFINAMTLSAERDRIYEMQLPNQAMQTQMGTFMKMTNLKTVKWPDMLYNLSQQSFYGCESLTNLLVYGKESEGNMLPYNMRSIDENVFVNCTSLTTINIPENSRLKAKTFGSAFLSNSGVTALYVPVSVNLIRDSAFQNAKNLTDVRFYNKDARKYGCRVP